MSIAKRLLCIILVTVIMSVSLSGCATTVAVINKLKEREETSEGSTAESTSAEAVTDEKTTEEKTTEEKTTEEPVTTPAVKFEDTADLAEYVQQRTVTVHVKTPYGEATGSGFYIDDKGTLVTCFHVIEEATDIYVSDHNGEEYEVERVMGFDWRLDVAVLSIKVEDNLYLEKPEKALRTGESVYAVGSSLGFLEGSFSDGTVATASRIFNGVDCIQTTAAISSGNSGGPLVNKNGEIVGINAFSFIDGDSLNFAVNFKYIDTLNKKRDMTVSEFSDWYEDEVDCSYQFFSYSEETFIPSLINTYQQYTSAECLYSSYTWDFEEFEDGYHEYMGIFMYEYSEDDFEEYCAYLESLGFELSEPQELDGGYGYTYMNEFLGYAFDILISFESNWVVIEPWA